MSRGRGNHHIGFLQHALFSSLLPEPGYSDFNPNCLENVSPFRHSRALWLECMTRVCRAQRQRNSCQEAKDHHQHCPLLFHLLLCLCDLSFLTAACTSLHIQKATEMQTIPFSCQNPPLNTHICLEGGDKRMNHIRQMSVTSLNASLEGTGILLRCGLCKR